MLGIRWLFSLPLTWELSVKPFTSELRIQLLELLGSGCLREACAQGGPTRSVRVDRPRLWPDVGSYDADTSTFHIPGCLHMAYLIRSLKDPRGTRCHSPILQKGKGSCLRGFSFLPTYQCTEVPELDPRPPASRVLPPPSLCLTDGPLFLPPYPEPGQPAQGEHGEAD